MPRKHLLLRPPPPPREDLLMETYHQVCLVQINKSLIHTTSPHPTRTRQSSHENFLSPSINWKLLFSTVQINRNLKTNPFPSPPPSFQHHSSNDPLIPSLIFILFYLCFKGDGGGFWLWNNIHGLWKVLLKRNIQDFGGKVLRPTFRWTSTTTAASSPALLLKVLNTKS